MRLQPLLLDQATEYSSIVLFLAQRASRLLTISFSITSFPILIFYSSIDPLDPVNAVAPRATMADSTPKSYHTDPTLYLYTSLTSGSSHIISATSRMQTILKANRIEFQALDVATDEKARMLWGRRAGKRKLPGLVRFGMIVGVRFKHMGRTSSMLSEH